MSTVDDVCLSDGKGCGPVDEFEGLCKDQQCVRRSTRDPSISQLDRNDLGILHDRIRSNHFSTIVLKVKDHILADINSSVFESIVDALWDNKVCQGLYIQNLSKAIGDDQLRLLLDLLKKKKIWCLNIGETYEVSQAGWKHFCDTLPATNVTHLYVSEHTIPIDLKNLMRAHIRENRKKHKLHCAFKNVSVIERCTHMWWNPINGVKELKPPPPPVEEPEPEEEAPPAPAPIVLDPSHTAYWQEGVGEGGEKPWKFKCVCGESCSSYENFRYHPTGRMYECANPACCLWSHVACVLGPNISDAELAKMKDPLCGACKAKSRRLSKYMGVSITELNAPPTPEPPVTTKGKGKGAAVSAKNKSTAVSANGQWLRPASAQDDENDHKPWSFKCKCGELCSSYENPLYHPAGQWFECSQCSVWSHVLCLLGPLTPEQVLEMKEVLCFSCTTKNRRNRSGRGLAAAAPIQPVVPPAAEVSVEAPAASESTVTATVVAPSESGGLKQEVEGSFVVQEAASTLNTTESFPYWAESTTSEESASSGAASILHEEREKPVGSVPLCELATELVKRKSGALAADAALSNVTFDKVQSIE